MPVKSCTWGTVWEPARVPGYTNNYAHLVPIILIKAIWVSVYYYGIIIIVIIIIVLKQFEA